MNNLGFKSAMKVLVLLFFMVNFLGCAALVGGEADQHRYISEEEASEIASNYLAEKNYPWGEPTSVSLVYNTYIFSYLTPFNEVPKLGGRTLQVDRLSGAVSVPLRF